MTYASFIAKLFIVTHIIFNLWHTERTSPSPVHVILPIPRVIIGCQNAIIVTLVHEGRHHALTGRRVTGFSVLGHNASLCCVVNLT